MPARLFYEYAVIRVVPRVDRGEQLNAGVVMYCLEREFLKARIALNAGRLRALDATADVAVIQQHLEAVPRVCEGGPGAGQLAALSMKERWHWLVAPRSALVQLGPVHAGLCLEPDAELDRLMRVLVD
ncbi:MAG: DUF3037 domain-containing protein [Myxococcaceae bacterium]|nr:DUF3037 domain-containing protein [Myxococcaceae bacterium]